MFILLLPLRWRMRIKKKPPMLAMYNIIAWFLVLWIIHTIGFKFIENVSWDEANWQTWQTFTTVGYGNNPASSTLGHWHTMIFSTGAIALLGAIFSTFIETNLWRKEQRRLGQMGNPIKNGIVVFNFPNESVFLMLVREYRYIYPDVGFCIVDGKINELPPVVANMVNIHFVKGSLLAKETYERANLKENKTIIVFPVEPGASHSDATTKTVVDLVEQIVPETTRIIHILVDPENKWLFSKSRSVSVMEALEILGLVQECNDPYSAVIVQKLLLNTEGSNPHTVRAKAVVGLTWYDFQIRAINTAKRIDMPLNPFAIIQNGETHTCPPPDTIIKEGDHLSVIAPNETFDWSRFENEINKDVSAVS